MKMTVETETETKIKSVTRKIKALLSKTIAAGATEAEAMSAFTLAHKLLAEYQLSLSDLDLREEGTSHIKQSMDHIAKRMSVLVGKYCECKVWMSDSQPVFKFIKVGTKQKKIRDGEQYTKINFIGIRSDADFAEWLMAALSSYVQGKEMAFLFGDYCGTADDAEDFVTGCINRINERLKFEIDKRNANKAASTGRDLVPLKNAMITEKFAALGITLNHKTATAYRVQNQSAYNSGVAAGNGVTFNRPVQAEDRTQRLLK